MAQSIQQLAIRTFRALQMNGYGRIDIRLDAAGQPWVLEANANPQLAYGEDFAESAHHVGVPYEALLQQILDAGLQWKADKAG
jgi:D-alanine-D-alanine ligase